MRRVLNDNFKKIVFEILKAILSIFAVLAINISMDKNIIEYNGNSILYILEFVLVYYISTNVLKKANKRMLIWTSLLAFLGAVIEVVGYSINNYMNLYGLFESYECMKKSIVALLGYFFLLNIINIIIFECVDSIKRKTKENKKTNKSKILIYWAFIFLCWLPYFLNYFPGLTTSDSMLQIYQSLGVSKLTAHHPVIHTVFIGLFMKFGKLINNYTIGVALYTIVQMLIMSFIFATTVYIMKKRHVHTLGIIISIVFYAMYPINPLFSLMMWKDILFAGIMLAFTLATCSMVNDSQKFFNNKKKLVLYSLIMIALMFFRNNGVYVIVLTCPFITIIMKKYWKKILLMFASTIIIYYVINSVIICFFGVEKGSVREALSIPMQQMARTVTYHKEELKEEELSNIKKYIKADNIEELYNPVISDPIKNNFDGQEFSNNKIDFIKLWLKLMIKYPTDYIESFICNSYGYYYPEAKHWVANRTMEKDDILNLQTSPIVEIKAVKKIDSYIEKREVPFISMLFSIGFIFWIITICFVYCIYKKEYRKVLIYIPVIMLWVTTLASPVFCEFRYVYSLVTCLPVFIIEILNKKE